MLLKDGGQALRCLDAGVVVIEAEHDFIELCVLPQHPEHGVFRRAAERHITVFLPVLRVQGDIREHIYRGFKHIQSLGRTYPMKAVPGIAALDVAAIALALSVYAPLMPVTRNAVFVQPDEHGVVINLGFIRRRLGALVDELFSCEGCQHLAVDVSMLKQISINTPHIRVRRWQRKGLALLHRLRLCPQIGHAGFAAEEHGDGIREAQTVELLHKVDGESAFLRGVVEPLIAAHGDAVIRGEALVPPGRYELLAFVPKELGQVDRVGAVLLLVGKMNILCDDARLQS